MKTRCLPLLICMIAYLGLFPAQADAAPHVESGVYHISNLTLDGFLGLGSYHYAAPYIFYVTDEEELTADAYWIVEETASGYTIRNEATHQLLVYTSGRADIYYKYMTLSSVSLGDKSEYWNIIPGDDGAFSIQSVVSTTHYWNLRSGTNLMGTYQGSDGLNWNERFVFHKKGSSPNPDDAYSFPEALHVYLSDGKIDAIPRDVVTDYKESNGNFIVQTNVGQNLTYPLAEVDSVSEKMPVDFPSFDTFRFNKKNNDQVFSSAVGEMIGDTVFVSIAAIGKRLTPTFTLNDNNALVYVDGILQSPRPARLRFDKDIYYVLSRRGCRILLPQDEQDGGGYVWKPYGRIVRVHADWLTDKAKVPAVYINTSDGLAVTSKDYYKDAEIIIDGQGIFPSMDTTYVQIKGRGNSTWNKPKKPYRLKFTEKEKPLGMTKGKSWVLLANNQAGSLLSNAVGMKAANLVGIVSAGHIVPVDLYMNGTYLGNYNFTEKVGFSNNSIDLDDESAAALLELDTYYDDPVGQKFRTSYYSLPVNIKEPEFSEGTTRLTLNSISSDFNRFLSNLYFRRDISQQVDIEQLARFLMFNELIVNYEFFHPKSIFCFRENFESDSSKYVFGPAWDFDWCFGYENNTNYFTGDATADYWTGKPSFEAYNFVRDLRFKYAPLQDIYYVQWDRFVQNGLQELCEYAQDFYDFAHNSFDSNAKIWGDYTDYKWQAQAAAQWLQSRVWHIYDDIATSIQFQENEHGEATRETHIYDLQGRRVERMNRGIYIQNGRKIVK